MLESFESLRIATAQCEIFLRRGGEGPPLLLLHGFPETHLMWRDVAPLLARRFSVVCPDLPGYGASGAPASASADAYSKRAMGAAMVDLMASLGFQRFSVAGHDRGGRVAYRLALDHPGRAERLALLDIVPTSVAWERADARFALGYWPWSLLAQPASLPERLVAGAPEAIVDAALGGWGTSPDVFPAPVRMAYIEALREKAHSICEEYRAAATLDRSHDEADRASGRRIRCPVLALWSAHGPLADWYAGAGGPLGVWRAWADDVRGEAVDAGHFFPEEKPQETARRLEIFLV
jgi:haloacetate dehalogenase